MSNRQERIRRKASNRRAKALAMTPPAYGGFVFSIATSDYGTQLVVSARNAAVGETRTLRTSMGKRWFDADVKARCAIFALRAHLFLAHPAIFRTPESETD